MPPRLVVKGLVKWAERLEQALEERGATPEDSAAGALRQERAPGQDSQSAEICISLSASEVASLAAALRAGQVCIETLVFGPPP